MPSHVSSAVSTTACVDDPTYIWNEANSSGWCKELTSSACNNFVDVWLNGKTAMMACCVCGGGLHRSSEPSLSPIPSYVPSSNALLALLSSYPSTVISLVKRWFKVWLCFCLYFQSYKISRTMVQDWTKYKWGK